MRQFALAAAAAALLFTAAPASAQKMEGAQPADPAMSKTADDAYRAECEPKAGKELCSCLVDVAASAIADPDERQVFYAYSTGDFEKARSTRALFEAEKNMKLNASLQKAENAVHERCDKLRPPAPAGQPTSAPAR